MIDMHIATWRASTQKQHCVQGETFASVAGQLPTRTIPHCTSIGPDEWFYSVVVVLVRSCPGGEYSGTSL